MPLSLRRLVTHQKETRKELAELGRNQATEKALKELRRIALPDPGN